MDQEKRKDRKSQKIISEEKVVSFSSASLCPARKWDAVIEGGTRVGIDHQTRRRTQGADIVKWWEKRDHGHISETFT